MKFFHSLVSLLCKGDSSFSTLETALLNNIGYNLDARRANRLKRRVKSINLVQRLDGGREVNAYAVDGGKPVFYEEVRLTTTDGEEKLAEFSFCGSNGITYKGAAWLFDGQLVSLEFNNPTEHILDDCPENVELSIYI